MRTTLATLFLLVFISEVSARKFEFSFFGFTEKNIRVKWEVYTNSPTGFPDGNVRTVTIGESKVSIDLRRGEKVVFEAIASDNSKKRSLLENRDFNQLSRRSTNTINFTVFEKKDITEILTIPQLALKVAQDKYASSLVRERDDILTDKDIPIGTLIFFDGQTSYYKPTTGIVTKEVNSQTINQYYHKIEDLIRVENNFSAGVSGSQLGFLKALSVDVDFSSVKFMDFRIEIDNLNKKQAQSYEKDPYEIFEDDNTWLEAVYNKINGTTDKSPYKLYFVTSKLSADKVLLRRRTYKEFNRSVAVGLNIESIIDVEGSGQHYSLASYEKLDSVLNYYVDFEAMDMTLVLLNEASKKAIGNEIDNMVLLKESLQGNISSDSSRVMDTYQLLTQYSPLPSTVTSINQVIAICKGRELETEIPYQLDSLGNQVLDQEITDENTRISEYNRYLTLTLDEISSYETKLGLLQGIESKILQLRTNTKVQVNKDTKISTIDKVILKNLIQGSPN